MFNFRRLITIPNLNSKLIIRFLYEERNIDELNWDIKKKLHLFAKERKKHYYFNKANVETLKMKVYMKVIYIESELLLL